MHAHVHIQMYYTMVHAHIQAHTVKLDAIKTNKYNHSFRLQNRNTCFDCFMFCLFIYKWRGVPDNNIYSVLSVRLANVCVRTSYMCASVRCGLSAILFFRSTNVYFRILRINRERFLILAVYTEIWKRKSEVGGSYVYCINNVVQRLLFVNGLLLPCDVVCATLHQTCLYVSIP